MTLDQLAKDGYTCPTPQYFTEDFLREKLLLAETRIFQLERENAQLRGAFPAHGPLPGLIAPKVRQKIEAHWTDAPVAKAKKAQKKASEVYARKAVFEAFSGICFYCQGTLVEHRFTIDHQIPKSKGGRNHRANLVAACVTCNTTKGDRMPTPVELERANAIREAYDSRPPNAQPIVPVVLAKPAPADMPSAFYTVNREKSLAEIEKDIEDKMALERELFGKVTGR